MRGSRILGIAAGIVALLGAGCGGGGETASPSGDASCVESFTSSAPDSLPALAKLSHAKDAPVIIGTYSGSEFSAETYDQDTQGDGTEITVADGACVITEVSPDFGPLYIFVEADDGAWHRFLESDPDVPLVPDPESKLEDVEEVEIEDIGA